MNQGLQIRYALLQVQLLLQYNTDSKINKLAKLRRCVSRVHFGQWPHGSISSKFGHHMAPLSLVPNLSTKWGHFQIWPPDGATCISSKFCHKMAPRALVPNLATRWGHCTDFKFGHLLTLQIGSPSGTTCIGSTFGHQVAPLSLVLNLAPRLGHLHCHIALDCPIGIIG